MNNEGGLRWSASRTADASRTGSVGKVEASPFSDSRFAESAVEEGLLIETSCSTVSQVVGEGLSAAEGFRVLAPVGAETVPREVGAVEIAIGVWSEHRIIVGTVTRPADVTREAGVVDERV